MPDPRWRFTNETVLTKLELTDIRRKQLAIVDEKYFLAIGNTSIIDMIGATGVDEEYYVQGTAMWEIVDGDSVVYDAYMYAADSGTIFKAGTTSVVAEVIQCGLQAYSKDASEAITAAHQVFAGPHTSYTLRYV